MKRLKLLFFNPCKYGLLVQKIDPNVPSTTSSRFQGSTLNIDWTLGELAITTIQGTTNIITQGFHQPNYVNTKLNDLTENSRMITLYPNRILFEPV